MRAAASGTVHVVGLGLAGLSAAVRLVEAGQRVALYEASGAAGGRCRSFYDPAVGAVIDNGNHLLMSGNDRALAYLDRIGGRDEVVVFPSAHFPFADLANGERWTVAIGDARLPLWALSPGRRVKGAGLWAHLAAARIAFAGRDKTVADVVGRNGTMVTRFWEPLTLAVLNAVPTEASAQLLATVLKATVAKGGRFARPVIAKHSLGAAFVEPALAFLTAFGAAPQYHARLREMTVEDGRALQLAFTDRTVSVAPDDTIILALPPHALAKVLPGTMVPDDRAVIVNAHFRVAEAATGEGPRFLGLINARTHWVFVRNGLISTTISGAHHLGSATGDGDALLDEIWREVSAALGLGKVAVAGRRLIREKRATFDQSPEGVKRRPQTTTALLNVCLAGDAVDTGLPATIEGAIRSGERAARHCLDTRVHRRPA